MRSFTRKKFLSKSNIPYLVDYQYVPPYSFLHKKFKTKCDKG